MDSDFDLVFRRQGFSEFTYHPETQTDPLVLRSQYTHGPLGGEYLVDEFYRRFGLNVFRKLLRRIYASNDGVAREALAQNCSNAEMLEEHLAYFRHQELAVESGGVIYKGERFQHISDIGRTMEWYVARWFEDFIKCHARYSVHVPGITGGGDLDVVAFMDGLRIWVECKSGNNIDDAHLRLFRQRAREFSPVMAVLLIDTDDKKMFKGCIERLDSFGHPDYPFELKNEREWLYWCGRPLYAVGVPHSIGESLSSVLRLYHDYVRFVAFAS
jgi:hypothetical protein